MTRTLHLLVLLSASLWTSTAAAQQAAPDTQAPPRQLDAQPGKITVELRVTPADAKIYQGEALLGQGSATLTLEPGEYTVRFERAGYTTLNQVLSLKGDGSLPTLLVQVHMSRNAPEREVVGRTGGLVEDMGDATRRRVGWAGLAVGLGLIGTSVYLGMESGVPEGCSSSTPARCDAASSAAPAITVGAFGGALLLGGLGLLVWDSLAGTPPEASSARVAPMIGPDGAGVVFGYSF